MARDWEKHHAALHQHSNIKFVKPTPRGHAQPVFERGEINMDKVWDRIILALAPALALGVVIGIALGRLP